MNTILKINSIIILLSFILTSCNSEKTATFWVNSSKIDCEGVGKTQCLLLSKNDTLEIAKWTNFHGEIDGFEFKPGVFQKIKVEETHLNPKNVPADASTTKYSLIEVLEEIKDKRLAINDIWLTTAINKKSISTNKLPQLEINISKMNILGTDGCNNINGAIIKLTETSISFGPIATTRKLCADMEISNKFNYNLAKTTYYKKEGLKLYFFDENGNEIITFKKID